LISRFFITLRLSFSGGWTPEDSCPIDSGFPRVTPSFQAAMATTCPAAHRPRFVPVRLNHPLCGSADPGADHPVRRSLPIRPGQSDIPQNAVSTLARSRRAAASLFPRLLGMQPEEVQAVDASSCPTASRSAYADHPSAVSPACHGISCRPDPPSVQDWAGRYPVQANRLGVCQGRRPVDEALPSLPLVVRSCSARGPQACASLIPRRSP
jgi:hypothetical protein